MAEVTLQDVVKKYGTIKVVHEVNLNIAAGEFVVLERDGSSLNRLRIPKSAWF